MAITPHRPEPHDSKDRPDDAHQQGEQQQTRTDPDHIKEARAAEARKIFDGYDNEKDLPVTTQTDQLRRAADMEKVGPQAYLEEQERRIRERQGDPPAEPRQVHGVAPAKKP